MRDLIILIPCRNDGKSLEKIILKLKYNLLIIDDFFLRQYKFLKI